METLNIIADPLQPLNDRVESALTALRSLPFARDAVFEYFTFVYEDAMSNQFTMALGNIDLFSYI